MADDPKARTFYVSWLDRKKDPWPKWADRTDGQPTEKGQVLTLTPADDPAWPGVPRGLDSKQPWRHLGPTLTALFHPRSPYCDLRGLDRVYLLYEPELGKRSPHDKLRDTLERICRVRGIDFAKRIRLTPIAGIADHTDHKQVIQRLEDWVFGVEDPFNLRRKPGKLVRHLIVNLGPGTPTKHACWLMLYWKGVLGDPPATFVKFVQGDSGPYTDEEQREPVRDVPIDVLSRFIGKEPAPSEPTTAESERADEWVRLEDLRSPPYEDLRKTIEQAALLGIPIVLYGERGTGKTFLARYYHERRQHYRRLLSGPATPRAAEEPRGPSNAPEAGQPGHFVPVTLSEYANLHELRDHLFGWARGSWTGATGEYHGLLGMAHRGTLFLDEIHHLDGALQASLLGVLNNRRYRPKMADYEVQSQFDLVVATNDPHWRDALADDFRDRIERVVLELPPFGVLQRHDLTDLWSFWEHTLKRRCRECGVEYVEITAECRGQLDGVFRHQPLAGNWRDLMRLADQVLLLLTAARGGRPTPLTWNRELLDRAIYQTFRLTHGSSRPS